MVDNNYFILNEFLEYEDFISFVNKVEPTLMKKRIEYYKTKKHNFGIYDKDVKMLYKLKKINVSDAIELEFFKSLTANYQGAYLCILLSNRESQLKEYKALGRALSDTFEILNRHYRSLNNYAFAFNVAEEELKGLPSNIRNLRKLDDIQYRMEKYAHGVDLEYTRLMEVEDTFINENAISFEMALNYLKEISKNIATATRRIQYICTFMNIIDETYKDYHINQLKNVLTPMAKKVLRNKDEMVEKATETMEEVFTFK